MLLGSQQMIKACGLGFADATVDARGNLAGPGRSANLSRLNVPAEATPFGDSPRVLAYVLWSSGSVQAFKRPIASSMQMFAPIYRESASSQGTLPRRSRLSDLDGARSPSKSRAALNRPLAPVVIQRSARDIAMTQWRQCRIHAGLPAQFPPAIQACSKDATRRRSNAVPRHPAFPWRNAALSLVARGANFEL